MKDPFMQEPERDTQIPPELPQPRTGSDAPNFNEKGCFVKKIKWVFLLALVFSSMGCASLEPNVFNNILTMEPAISPEQLQIDLNSTPVIDKKVSDSFRYQVYKVGFPTNLNAVYFKGDHIVAHAPYDQYTNIKTLLQLGAISQDEYNKENAQFQSDNTAASDAPVTQIQTQVIQDQQPTVPQQTTSQQPVPQQPAPQQAAPQQAEPQEIVPQQSVPQPTAQQRTDQPTDDQQDQLIEQEIDRAQQEARQAERAQEQAAQ